MKIFHLASFSGNIGDKINHEGFYNEMKKNGINFNYVHQEEIRDYYYNSQLKKFDKSFVEEVNKFDLFILGGGNFFELWWDYSETGTTFNIPLEFLRKIDTPIFVNAIGVDDKIVPSLKNINKFRKFLDICLREKNALFTVRNDGSYQIFNKYFSEYTNHIIEIPDWGFYYPTKIYNSEKKRKIGLNIVKDLPEIRYSKVGYIDFINMLAKQVDNMLERNDERTLLFLPHILSDIEASNDLIKALKTKNIRKKIEFAPLYNNEERELIKNYESCEMIIGMRFHSNILALRLGVPIVGIHNFPKHVLMQRKIKRNSKFYIDVTNSLSRLEELNKYSSESIMKENKDNQKNITKCLELELLKNIKVIKRWFIEEELIK